MQGFDLRLIQGYISICISIDFIRWNGESINSILRVDSNWLNITSWWPKWSINKYWFECLKSHRERGGDVKEPSQFPGWQFEEERRRRHFDYLKNAAQKEEMNPDFDTKKSQTNWCEIVITVCLK